MDLSGEEVVSKLLGFLQQEVRRDEGDKLIRKISWSENWQPEECVSSYWFKQFVISNSVQANSQCGGKADSPV